MSKTYKTKNDPSFRIPTVKVEVRGGIVTIVRKDKGISLVINDMDVNDDNEKLGKDIVSPSYETIRKK